MQVLCFHVIHLAHRECVAGRVWCEEIAQGNVRTGNGIFLQTGCGTLLILLVFEASVHKMKGIPPKSALLLS